ncbi:Deoxyuridine 5'-triphosphate nucleotidohydrolase, partial [Orchesella cincta]
YIGLGRVIKKLIKKCKMATLHYVKLSTKARNPTRGSAYSAGIDLKSAYPYKILKHGSCLIKTDLQIQLPPGTYGRIAPRSGLALHNHICVGGGVIDPDYRGNLCVILYNHSDVDFHIEEGDRVAQLIAEKFEHLAICEALVCDKFGIKMMSPC